MREVLVHLNIEAPGEPPAVDALDDGFGEAVGAEVLRRLANALYGLPLPLLDHVAALVEMDLDACAGDDDEPERQRAGEQLSDLVEAAREFRLAALNGVGVTSAEAYDLGLIVAPLAEEI